MSDKQHHSEAGRTRGERRKHDAAVKHHEENVYSEPSQPKWVLYTLYVVIGVVVVSLTLLFVGGFIKW